MSEEDASTAFEPFRRSARVTDQIAGSGLGLFVVRRLVEAQGGRIGLETRLGSGSTFSVWLPLRACARRPRGASSRKHGL